MTSGFNEIFGKYICNRKHLTMLSNAKVLSVDIDKEDLTLNALLSVDLFENIMCLKATANEIKKALNLRSVQLDFILPPSQLKEECFPVLLRVAKVNIPVANGFLDDAKISFDDDKFTIELANGGCDVLSESGLCEFLTEYVKEHFNRDITVEVKGDDLDMTQFLDARKEADKALAAKDDDDTVDKPHEIVEGFPLYFETMRPIYGTKITSRPVFMKDTTFEDGRVTVWGDVIKKDEKKTRDGRSLILKFLITDYTNSYY
ncbi:MAG TPA: hypothetical protein VFD25_05115, partial [Clostridia bacterium]|nr:hypothetical protein [Clostridia bacterium]